MSISLVANLSTGPQDNSESMQNPGAVARRASRNLG